MDEELAELVASELVRLIATLEEEPGVETARRAAHAMRGSLGLVGEREAASAFSRLERRLAGGEASAVDETRSLLTQILERVRTGAPLATSVWPEPPQDLRPSVVPEAIADDYVAEVRARLSSIDAALLDEDEDYALDEIYRAVHTLKGAALSASDEVMGWFCHGLEDRLKLGRGPDGDTAAALGESRA